MTSHTQNDDQPRAIDRRRLVRGAATVAWAVPAISVASAVPAFAAASGCCNVSLTGTATWRTGGLNYIDIPLHLTNGCGTAVQGLTVTLTVCGVDDLTYGDEKYLPAGWTQAGKANKTLHADQNGCYTLSYLSGMSLAGNGTTDPQFTVKSQAYVGSGNNRPAGSITAQVSTTGCSSQLVAIAVPKV